MNPIDSFSLKAGVSTWIKPILENIIINAMFNGYKVNNHQS